MRELDYTPLELEQTSRKICDFCLGFEINKSVRQLRSRVKETGKWISDYVFCEDCEEKYWNGELLKCERCGRLQTRHDFSFRTGKYTCDCIRYNENLEEKELPELPYESQSTFYERQINGLREKERELTEEIDVHLEALETAEDWHKRQKQELLDRIKELETEIRQLKELTPQGLVERLKVCESENEQLKTQLEQLTSQPTAKVETPPKNGIKNFFKFGLK